MNQVKDKMKLEAADQDALKAGAKTCCLKFTEFVDKFTELIFCKWKGIMFIQYSVRFDYYMYLGLV